MSIPTKEEILSKHLSTDHALASGLHFTHDLVYAAMDEWRTIGEREAADSGYEQGALDLTAVLAVSPGKWDQLNNTQWIRN